MPCELISREKANGVRTALDKVRCIRGLRRVKTMEISGWSQSETLVSGWMCFDNQRNCLPEGSISRGAAHSNLHFTALQMI